MRLSKRKRRTRTYVSKRPNRKARRFRKREAARRACAEWSEPRA